MDFSPDGRLLACGTERGCVEVIDVDLVRATTLISCFEDGSVDAVAFSPNGTMLVCGGGQRGLTRVVDTNHWKIVATLRTWGGWRIHCLAFSSDGKRLATGMPRDTGRHLGCNVAQTGAMKERPTRDPAKYDRPKLEDRAGGVRAAVAGRGPDGERFGQNSG